MIDRCNTPQNAQEIAEFPSYDFLDTSPVNMLKTYQFGARRYTFENHKTLIAILKRNVRSRKDSGEIASEIADRILALPDELSLEDVMDLVEPAMMTPEKAIRVTEKPSEPKQGNPAQTMGAFWFEIIRRSNPFLAP